MKILIDECLPAGLKGSLAALGYECETVRRAGYRSKKNGELLQLAEGQWDALLTSDRNIKHQQNLTGRNVSIDDCGADRDFLALQVDGLNARV